MSHITEFWLFWRNLNCRVFELVRFRVRDHPRITHALLVTRNLSRSAVRNNCKSRRTCLRQTESFAFAWKNFFLHFFAVVTLWRDAHLSAAISNFVRFRQHHVQRFYQEQMLLLITSRGFHDLIVNSGLRLIWRVVVTQHFFMRKKCFVLSWKSRSITGLSQSNR